MRPCSGNLIPRLVATTALALSLCGAAEARPSPERLAAALAAVIWDGAPPPDATERLRAGIVAEYPLLDAAIARGEPDYIDATLSAALLAREASHPATRRAMYDIARYLLAHAVEDAETNPMLAEWRAMDPVQEPLGLGTGLAVSDFAATAFLLGLEDPPGADPSPRMAEALTRLTSVWSEQAESPSRRFILTRLDAWTVGILANRAALSPEQRAEAADMPWSGATPSPETTKLVTGVP
ncbi:hypothetical protein, partial [Neomegalonema sp.]|uniref:hypothetical protein n=1 Tax=Neomegalonema sp. TaxID=2039713 RepID=UPI0026344F19